MIRVTFVHQNCFVVELDHHLLVFDYIPDTALLDCQPPIRLHGHLPLLPEDKKLYFFVTNSQKDSYDPKIFEWLEKRKDTVYILPRDLKIDGATKRKYGLSMATRKRVKRMGVRQNLEVGDLEIYTLNPNTIGVAYFVTCEGLRIYHAGDLNWWNWGVERELYSQMSGANYKRELRHLKEKHIDLAFVDLDGRLGDGARLGMSYFLRHIPADLVFPMHLWQDYGQIRAVKEDPELRGLADKVVSIDRENIVYEIPDDRRSPS
ncbi:MAG: hypothetical protein PUF56_06785 [Lachnospiraceae bacterium]|nr:hypothetical protein [Lachnospiraceae bacterium]MDD6451621.1 hypothetical protein [Lachnospiraceae bacterium]